MAPEPAHIYPLIHSTREGDMLPAFRFYIALSCSLAWHPVVASPQSSQAQAVKSSGDAERAEPSETAKLTEKLATRTRAARELALNYINLWSAPNPVALASAPSFYGSVVRFHGSVRSAASVIAEKRRFVQRWPNRDYRYRPGETFVGCEAKSDYCTVWSIFDFSATNAETQRHSRGIAEHELIVSFESEWPIIVSEKSRVLLRGVALHADARR